MTGLVDFLLEYPPPTPPRDDDMAWEEYRVSLWPEQLRVMELCEAHYGVECFGQEEYPNFGPGYFIPP